jgi:hypothetical protein
MAVGVVIWTALAARIWCSEPATTTTVTVRDAAGLRQALAKAQPGTQILLEPGEYSGGFSFANLRGEPGKPIVVAAADPKNPPIIQGGGAGMHLTDPAYLELRNLTVSGWSANGLNIDDGGSYDTPAHHIVLRGLKVIGSAPPGNRDGIKLSGVDDFRVEDCTIEGWGTGGGSAVDMVGCHRGVIEGCTIRHKDAPGSTGVQAKGGSSDVVVRRNRFENAGGRAVNIGGSTGLPYFRPPVRKGEGQAARYCEAKDIRVEGNVFVGGLAPVAFVGCDGSVVRFNTIYRPKRWVLRILQETREPGFVPSRNGEFTDNIIAFRSNEMQPEVNSGPNTAPETFRFARNFWYCLDAPAKSRPSLPTPEVGGVYGQDPLFRDAEGGDVRLQPNSPAQRVGAEALP